MERCILLLGLLLSSATMGATYNVQLLLDYPDSNIGDGVCNSTFSGSSTDCTLRAAIQEANAHPGTDTINFDVARCCT